MADKGLTNFGAGVKWKFARDGSPARAHYFLDKARPGELTTLSFLAPATAAQAVAVWPARS